MKVYDAASIRNVAVVGHGGSGKTQLVSALLFDAGMVNRLGKVDEGNTVTDYDEEEIRRKISIYTSVIPLEYRDVKVNLLDAPGHKEFLKNMVSGAARAEAALLVIDAGEGVIGKNIRSAVHND
mgnify:CR=1 FL=1